MQESTALTTNFSITPQAKEFAEIISKSSFCPKPFQGKWQDVLIAIQMGKEVGLAPMQSLQNIAVINGRPSVWGDAAIALAKIHPNFESIDESIDGDIEKENAIAFCTIKRKGENPQTRTFSVADAKQAKLWKKDGPWTQYPKRMLQLRARSFALRDTFPDALKGLSIAEEAQDYSTENIKRCDNSSALKQRLNEKLKLSCTSEIDNDISNEEIIDHETGEICVAEKCFSNEYEEIKNKIHGITDFEELKILMDLARSLTDESEKDYLRKIFKEKIQEFKEAAK